MCQTLGIARGSYYQSQHKTDSKRSYRNEELTKKIIPFHQKSGNHYIVPRVYQSLLKQRLRVSIQYVQRLI